MKQIIEAEGGEYYLGKNQEGMIRGKSHAEGGVDMLAETNDFIFPKKYAKIAQTLREEMMGYQKEIERYSKNSKKYGNKDVVESGMQRLQQRNNMGIEAAAAKLKELMLITAVEKQQKEANKYAKGSFIKPPFNEGYPFDISKVYVPDNTSGIDDLGGTSLRGSLLNSPVSTFTQDSFRDDFKDLYQAAGPNPYKKTSVETDSGNPPMFSYGDAAIFAGGIAPMLYNFIMGSKPAEEYKLGRVKKLSPTLVSDAAALRDQRTVLSSLIAGTKRSRLTPAQRQALLSGIAATGLRGMQDTSLNFANQNAGIINQTNAQNAQIDAQNIGFQDKENNINMANRAARTNFTTKGFENLNSMLVNAGQGLNKKQQGLDLYDIYMSNPDYFRALFENGKFKGTEYITS